MKACMEHRVFLQNSSRTPWAGVDMGSHQTIYGTMGQAERAGPAGGEMFMYERYLDDSHQIGKVPLGGAKYDRNTKKVYVLFNKVILFKVLFYLCRCVQKVLVINIFMYKINKYMYKPLHLSDRKM